VNRKIWCFLNLLWCCNIPEIFAAHHLLPGLLCDSLNQTDKLCILNLQQGESQWFLIGAADGNQLLTPHPASMSQVVDFLISPSKQWLAILSVGEGHPIVDIVELTEFLHNHEPKTLISINPFPGTINLVKWQKNQLLVTSDRRISQQNEELSRVEKFYVAIDINHTVRIYSAPAR